MVLERRCAESLTAKAIGPLPPPPWTQATIDARVIQAGARLRGWTYKPAGGDFPLLTVDFWAFLDPADGAYECDSIALYEGDTLRALIELSPRAIVTPAEGSLAFPCSIAVQKAG